MIKDTEISIKEFFKTYTKQAIISYIEDLYYIHDCFRLYYELQSKK